MVRNCRSLGNWLIEGWNDNQLSELECGRGDCAAKGSEIVLVAVSNLLDESMGAKPLEHTGQLRRRDALKAWTEAARLESADGELAADYGLEEIQVSAVEQIETTIAPVTVAHRRGDFLQGADASAGIIDSRQEVEVAMGGCADELMQRWQTVDGLAHGSELECCGPVAMFHRTVVLKKSHVIGGAFHAPDQAELVVELDSHRPHVVFDACALDAGMEVVPDLPLVVGGQLASEESDYVLRLDSVDGSVGNGGVEGLEIALVPEDHVGGVLYLHQAPVIPRAEISSYRAVLGRDLIQVPVKSPDIQGVGQGLGAGEVGNVDEGIFQQGVRDSFFLKLDGQLVMPIEIELQAERCPSGYTQVAQSQLWVDEVEVVMQTFRLGGLEESLSSGLVMPGLERGAGFHCREDVDQTGVITTLGDDCLDALLLPEVVALDELNLQSTLAGELLSACAYLLTEWLGKQRVIEEANAPDPQMPRHRLRMADVGKRASNHHPVKTGQSTTNFGCMSIYKCLHRGYYCSIHAFLPVEGDEEDLFGSGYAGLGDTAALSYNQ